MVINSTFMYSPPALAFSSTSSKHVSSCYQENPVTCYWPTLSFSFGVSSSSCCCWAVLLYSGLSTIHWKSHWPTWTSGASSAFVGDGVVTGPGGGTEAEEWRRLWWRGRMMKKRSGTQGWSCTQCWTPRPNRRFWMASGWQHSTEPWSETSHCLCSWDISGFSTSTCNPPVSQSSLICDGWGSQCGLSPEEQTLCPHLHSPNTWPCMTICICAV